METIKKGTKRTKKSESLSTALDKLQNENASNDVERKSIRLSSIGWDNTHKCPEYKVIDVTAAKPTGDPKKEWVILHLMENVHGKLKRRTCTLPINVKLKKWEHTDAICKVPLPAGHTIASLMAPRQDDESLELYRHRMDVFQARINNSMTVMDMIREELPSDGCKENYYLAGLKVCTWFTTKVPKDPEYARKNCINVINDDGTMHAEGVYWSTLIKDDEGKLFETTESGDIISAQE